MSGAAITRPKFTQTVRLWHHLEDYDKVQTGEKLCQLLSKT